MMKILLQKMEKKALFWLMMTLILMIPILMSLLLMTPILIALILMNPN